jgi:competence protein ComEC
MIVFYVVIGVYTVLPRWRLPRRWTLALASLWIVGALGLSSASVRDAIQSEPEPLACHFVSVGHGVGIVVELPDGRTLLYDTGKLGSPLGAARPVSAVLWSRGITHLDAIVISHADADHFSGIPELLDRFSVGVIYVSPYMFERKQPAVDELMQAITVHRVPLREVQAGDTLQTSDSLPGSASSSLAPPGRGAESESTPGTRLRMRILHPGRDAAINNDNANSIVLAIEYAGRRMLLTGDLESQGLKDLLANEAVDCDIVLAPHHGSPRSQPAGFADWSTPEYVVISGARNVEDIPAIERVKNSFRLRGAEVFQTAEDGCVTFRITTGGEIEVTTFRPHVRATPQSVDQNSPVSE